MVERYLAPTTLDEALKALAAGDATIVAGGTDVMPQSQAGRFKLGRTLVNIRRVAGLQGGAKEGDEIRLGALTTISQLREDAFIAKTLPVLAEAADHFASVQIRNMGTLGGNIGNASPAGDTLVPLLVLDAVVELRSAKGMRRLRLDEFFTGPGKTKRTPDELITNIFVPAPKPGFVARFAKFGTRPALDISAVSVGIAGIVKDGKISNVRVAYGAVAPTPVRGRAAEAALEGKTLDAATLAAAAKAAQGEVKPISDRRATAWYRREMIHNLVKKVLADVAHG
ncbi:MAG: xanthine dehydrogenase family protein subunit M [Rhodospirillales bacterium]|nr:xanthine dehydrogenase family protein subunit M [Rhodospirillales bacterium]